MDRLIAHVDMDSFFTAVEVLDDPSLKGRPVIVGADPKAGRGRGVVAAASYEAREFGVHSAMPISRAFRLCPQAIYLKGRMSRYQEVSQQVMDLLASFTPMWEQISVDEAFLDLTGCQRLWGPPLRMCRRIKEVIRQNIGLTASVGLGSNKLVAKVASDLKKPDGLVIVEPGREKEFLAPLPLRKLWGIGPRTETALKKDFGISTIEQLASLPPAVLERRYGLLGYHLHQRANGIDHQPVGNEGEAKSVGREITFEKDTSEQKILQRTLIYLCDRVASRLKRAGLAGRTITLKIRYQGFETHTHCRTLVMPTDIYQEILEAAKDLFGLHYQAGRRVRLLGVSVSNFSGPATNEIFDSVDGRRERTRKMERVVESIRQKFGKRAVIRAGEL